MASLSQLRLGSLTLEVECEDQRLRDILQTILRTRLESAEQQPDLRLSLAFSSAARYGSHDDLVWTSSGVCSDLIQGQLQWETRPYDLHLTVDPSSPRLPFLDHYLLVLLNSILRRMGALRLHAAGVLWQGKTLLFLGPKGSGKSTLSLYLCRQGGTVLAEDQVLLRADPWQVSGCDGRIRLTEETERFFFSEPLAYPAQDYAGTLKKELELSELGRAMPFMDHRVHAVYFPSVGRQAALRPLKRVTLVQRLCQDLLPTHRFSDASERLWFLEWVTGFAGAVKSYQLELSPDLRDLPRVLELL